MSNSISCSGAMLLDVSHMPADGTQHQGRFPRQRTLTEVNTFAVITLVYSRFIRRHLVANARLHNITMFLLNCCFFTSDSYVNRSWSFLFYTHIGINCPHLNVFRFLLESKKCVCMKTLCHRILQSDHANYKIHVVETFYLKKN